MKHLLPFCTLLLFICFTSFSFAQTTLTVSSGKPILDGVIDSNEWTSDSLVTQNGVVLRSMADGQYLYIAATWEDTSESIAKKQWSFDRSAWSQSGNEDRIALIWDMGTNGSDGPNCTTMCHAPLMHTNIGKVDVWHWKAARGNAMGSTDDKYWDTDDRHSDPGTSTYMDNPPMGSGFPSFMASNDPGANVDFLVDNQDALNAFDPFGTVLPARSVEVAVPFDSNATFAANSTIPGYVLRIPQGDRASVMSAGKYENGRWTVEFKRPYDTGSDLDFKVVPGSSVDFTHEIFDNEGGTHAFNGFDATIYTLDFSTITGVKSELVVEIPENFMLRQNYPNPFNPTTTIAFKIPERSKVTLKVFNILGEEVTTLINGEELLPGDYHVDFNASNLASGVYLYMLKAQNFMKTKKMILIK